MKKIQWFILLFLLNSLISLGQTDGLTYQAIILNPDPNGFNGEIPGVDVSSAVLGNGNVLSNKTIEVRFTIVQSTGTIDYQEFHSTSTDQYGLINLVIGQGTALSGVFTDIDWDATPRNLIVEMNYASFGYLELSNQPLYFIPYAYHRNITATGTLDVDGATNLNDSLTVNNNSPTYLTGTLDVDGATNLNDSLTVNNYAPTYLTGTLDVDGATNLNDSLIVNNDAPTYLTGALDVDGATNLNDSLTVNNNAPTYLTGTLDVDGATNLNDSLTVNNNAPTYLTGTLDVDGATNLNDSLTVNNNAPTYLTGTLDVDGATNLNDSLTVNNNAPTYLTGTLDVDGATNLNDSLTVNNNAPTHLTGTLSVDGATVLNSTADIFGQVTINATLTGTEGDYDAYPLRVEGSDQGIAIKVNASTPNNGNNFITFFDQSNNAVGRIEGQTASEVASSPEFIYENSILIAEEVAAGVNVGLSALPTCVGGLIVSCGVSASSIAMAVTDLVLATANLTSYNVFAFQNLGVTYESGSADYAEWLERSIPNELILPGEIVGVRAGKISKDTRGAEQLMVISTKPALLGNMPDSKETFLYNKVAFMGQVPVKVKGTVFNGDYILPSGNNDGIGIAISPDEISYNDYNKIVGIAWSESFLGDDQVSFINMAIGLNPNAISKLVAKQEEKYQKLELRLENLESRISGLETNGNDINEELAVKERSRVKSSEEMANETTVSRYQFLYENMPSELSDEIIEESFEYLNSSYKERGIDISKHEGLNMLFNDPVFKADIIAKTKENYKKNYQVILSKAKAKK